MDDKHTTGIPHPSEIDEAQVRTRTRVTVCCVRVDVSVLENVHLIRGVVRVAESADLARCTAGSQSGLCFPQQPQEKKVQKEDGKKESCTEGGERFETGAVMTMRLHLNY